MALNFVSIFCFYSMEMKRIRKALDWGIWWRLIPRREKTLDKAVHIALYTNNT